MDSDPSRIWLSDILQVIARFLPINEIPCTIRLVNRAAARQFRQHTTVRLGLPTPSYEFRRHWTAPEATHVLTWAKRRALVALTAATGIISNLEVAAAVAGCSLTADIIETSAAAGKLDACVWLLDRGCPPGHCLAAAAGAGHTAVCEWLVTKGPLRLDAAILAAARGGHLHLMLWLLRLRGAPLPAAGGTAADASFNELMSAALEGCSLPDVRRLLEERMTAETSHQDVQQLHLSLTHLLAAAAASSTPDWQAKVIWVEALGVAPVDGAAAAACCEAAAAVRPDTEAQARLAWLLDTRRYAPNSKAARAAAGVGNVDALRYLLDLTQPLLVPDFLVSMRAAMSGSLAALQELHARGCLSHQLLLASFAAQRGHFDAVLWIIEATGLDGAMSTSDSLAQHAAAWGDMAMLTWLRQRGWPVGTQAVFQRAAKGGSAAVLEWLVEHGGAMADDGLPYTVAASNGDLATLRCLQRLGCPWSPAGDTFTRCIELGCPREALGCLLELGCPVDWGTALAEAERRAEEAGRGEDTVLWLRERRAATAGGEG